MDYIQNDDVLVYENICKSISGKEDKNGNYIFEVEASNENLDLQNQRTLQSALLKSKEYFLSNGVISDDHLHKTRNPDGSVETHKDKIIGEPISIRTDGKSTFVKGILYKGVKAAKDYIELLKNNSTRVKASIGGIMPKIRKNADGSETVTEFMWNDLALTCSPVNWTVGSAKFAKSIGLVDFCKSLNAGSGTDAETMENGRVLQNEDIEEKTSKLLDITDGEFDDVTEDEELKKNKNNCVKKALDEETENQIIKKCVELFTNGEIKKSEITDYLINEGVEKPNAECISAEIIYQGGMKMAKSQFKSELDELLKSFGAKDKNPKAKDDMDIEEEEIDLDIDMSDEDGEDNEDDEDVKKCGVKKSSEYLDATEMMKSICSTTDTLKEENEVLKSELKETKEALLEVTKSFKEFLGTPTERDTVVTLNKSISENKKGPAKRPTEDDFDILKKALVNAAKNKEIGINEVQFYNSEFQKSMKGIKIEPKVWNKICTIVKNNK